MFSNISRRVILLSKLKTNLQKEISKRWFESENKISNPEPLIFQTHTLVQEGEKIQELPMIVQRILNIGDFFGNKIEEDDKLKVEILDLKETSFNFCFYLFIFNFEKKSLLNMIILNI